MKRLLLALVMVLCAASHAGAASKFFGATALTGGASGALDAMSRPITVT